MEIIRIINGMLYNDEFDSTTLNKKWLLIPNDSTRYSLVERSGFLKLFHGNPNLMLLLEEPDSEYVFDLRNEYVPNNELIQAGIIVFKSQDNSLELLEYYDQEQSTLVVYEFLRIERSNGIYTAYGKNTSSDSWELIGSGEFESAGKVGIVLIGDRFDGAPDLNLDYVRVYKNHTVQVINVPKNYTVSLCNEDDTTIGAKLVDNPYSGVEFSVNDIPPFRRKFKVYDETNKLVCETVTFDMVGGDVYYYGAMPAVKVNGEDVYSDGECFLGYFTSNIIDFDIEIINPYSNPITNLLLSAVKLEDNVGYQFVTFSSDNINFSEVLEVPAVSANSSIHLYGRISRDMTVVPSSIDPFKFNLGLSYKE